MIFRRDSLAFSPPESDPAADVSRYPVAVERLRQQSTPLFISLTRPLAADTSRLTDAHGDAFTAFPLDGLWITTRVTPRTFAVPHGAVARVDLSWDPIFTDETK